MGRIASIVGLAVAVVGCAGATSGPSVPAPSDLHGRIVADFERGTVAGEEAYARLFDFAAVGKFEKLLHRYDLRGRSELTEAQKEQFQNEDATPFSVERERRNLGHYFFPMLAQRTVGTGGCKEAQPIDEYAKALGRPFEPLGPQDASYETLRGQVNALIEKGGILALRCTGGNGQLVVVYTKTETPRGYDLITLYDDVGAAP